MNVEEWELLCDGCGLCCLIKIEDEDSGEIFNTTVSCQQLDIENCRCKDYENRLHDIPMCIQLTMSNLPEIEWLPETCAYRRLYNNQALPSWHPLLTGDNNAVHDAGVSAKWFAQSETYVHPEQLVSMIIMRPVNTEK